MRVKDFFLIATAFLWGVLTGGIVFSHLVYFPAWLADLPATAAIVNEPFGMIDDPFWGSIHPVATMFTVICLIMHWKTPRRKFILITSLIYLVALIGSMTYYVPELVAFAESPTSGISAAEWKERADLWLILSWIRGLFMFAGFVSMLLALQVPADRRS